MSDDAKNLSMSDELLCTVLKPMIHQQRPYALGQTLTLTRAQARPLQHAGLITLDQAAAACIQSLVTNPDSTETEWNDSVIDDEGHVPELELEQNRPIPSAYYEQGD